MKQFSFISKKRTIFFTFFSFVLLLFIGFNAHAQVKDLGEIVVYQTPQ